MTTETTFRTWLEAGTPTPLAAHLRDTSHFLLTSDPFDDDTLASVRAHTEALGAPEADEAVETLWTLFTLDQLRAAGEKAAEEYREKVFGYDGVLVAANGDLPDIRGAVRGFAVIGKKLAMYGRTYFCTKRNQAYCYREVVGGASNVDEALLVTALDVTVVNGDAKRYLIIGHLIGPI